MHAQPTNTKDTSLESLLLTHFGSGSYEDAEGFVRDLLKTRPNWPQEVRKEFSDLIKSPIHIFFEQAERDHTESYLRSIEENHQRELREAQQEDKEVLGRVQIERGRDH